MLWQNKVKTNFDNILVYILSLDDLIINKSNTNRAKDLLDVEQLKKLKDMK